MFSAELGFEGVKVFKTIYFLFLQLVDDALELTMLLLFVNTPVEMIVGGASEFVIFSIVVECDERRDKESSEEGEKHTATILLLGQGAFQVQGVCSSNVGRRFSCDRTIPFFSSKRAIALADVTARLDGL